MLKGYWIVFVDVTDKDQYDHYRAAVGATLTPFGGKFIVRAGASEQREGSAKPRVVVIEFPSFPAAKACYDSPAYQQVRKLRETASTANITIVEGWQAD